MVLSLEEGFVSVSVVVVEAVGVLLWLIFVARRRQRRHPLRLAVGVRAVAALVGISLGLLLGNVGEREDGRAGVLHRRAHEVPAPAELLNAGELDAELLRLGQPAVVLAV